MNIEVNKEKCGNAMDCRVCLDVCPSRVFLILPPNPTETDPTGGTETIFPVFLSACVACDLCVEKCPNEAISLIH